MADDSPEQKSGCGLLNAVFGRRWPRRTTSAGSLPMVNGITDNHLHQKAPSTTNSKRRRNSSADDESQFSEDSAAPNNLQESQAQTKPSTKPPPPIIHQHPKPPQNNIKKPEAAAAAGAAINSSNNSSSRASATQGYVNQGRRVPREVIGISGELEMMISDHQKTRGSSNLVRASSSNMMLYGNLGNIRQGGGGGGNVNTYDHVNEYLPNTKPSVREESSSSRGNNNYNNNSNNNNNNNNRYPNSVMGNVVKKQTNDHHRDHSNYNPPKPASSSSSSSSAEPSSLCRALSTRMDPETLKIMGNEDYKAGNFAEALALYDAAISIDPNKASYRSNKTAALTALGRLLEAVFECREAIRIEPHYHRAHLRLANLYLRLGEAEKAIYHYKHAGPEADQVDIAKAKSLQAHLNKCTDAKRTRDWNSLIKETKAAITAGADSAPQIYALQAEALMKLNKHQEAEERLANGPNFEVDECTRFFGPIGNANLLVVRAQVNLACGRFEDALTAIQKATKLDSNNKEVNMVMRKAKGVAAARSNGNSLFKQSKFSEAAVAYGDGLGVDPYNSVLLCNRAACLSKLGQFDKSIEDCNAALNLRPGYSKARLRRADCFAKMEKWEASLQDYEILKKESPDDEEVNQALQEVQAQIKKQRGGV